MNILVNWGARNTRMTISSHKSKLLILKGNMTARPPVIKYRDVRIAKLETATYLGVEIDTGLTFLPHVKKQGSKARTLFGKIGRLLKVSLGANTVNLNFLYKTSPSCLTPPKRGYIDWTTGQSPRILKKRRARPSSAT